MRVERIRGDAAMQMAPKRGSARIIRDPRICGGDPVVAGTRIPVHSVVIQWQLYHDIDRLMQAFPRLDAAAIQTALAFYEANRAEIDALIEEHERAAYSAD
jgi:uncharacterized protein (DUF433 family)